MCAPRGESQDIVQHASLPSPSQLPAKLVVADTAGVDCDESLDGSDHFCARQGMTEP